MTRLLLALIVVTAAGAGTEVTTHKHATDARAVVAPPLQSREPELRPTRSFRRPPLAGRRRADQDPVRAHGQQRWHNWLQFDVTMYCATGHHTASGQWPRLGMAAGNRWPFGTHLHIDGYGTGAITDRIGWGSDVDIFGGNDPGCERRALNFGRRHLLVEVTAS